LEKIISDKKIGVKLRFF